MTLRTDLLNRNPTKTPDLCFDFRHHTALRTQSCWRKLLKCFTAFLLGLNLTVVCAETSFPHCSWRSRPQVIIDLFNIVTGTLFLLFSYKLLSNIFSCNRLPPGDKSKKCIQGDACINNTNDRKTIRLWNWNWALLHTTSALFESGWSYSIYKTKKQKPPI